MEKKGIVISYSRTDRKWLNLLKPHLDSLRNQHQIPIWDDSQIDAGKNWKEEIEKAFEASSIAILLVSASFISSDFIMKQELPRILDSAQNRRTVIFTIVVSHCLTEAIAPLRRIQFFNDPSRPLISMSDAEREKLFSDLTRDISRSLSFPEKSKSNIFNHGALPLRETLKISFSRVATFSIFYHDISPKGLTITQVYRKSKVDQRKEVVQTIHEMVDVNLLSKNREEKTTYYKLTDEGRDFIRKYKKSIF